jgi:hypothetical protein
MLQKANVDATRRYENLLRAIESSSSGAEQSASYSETPEASSNSDKHSTYVLVDEDGRELLGRRSLFENEEIITKIKKISNLIDEVEKVQEDIRKATNQAGIWEMVIKTDLPTENRHFRYTSVSKHLDLPNSGNISSGVGSIPTLLRPIEGVTESIAGR